MRLSPQIRAGPAPAWPTPGSGVRLESLQWDKPQVVPALLVGDRTGGNPMFFFKIFSKYMYPFSRKKSLASREIHLLYVDSQLPKHTFKMLLVL